MVFCLIIALLATLIYINLLLSDAINLKVNPGFAASRNDETAVLIAKIKYVLLFVMAVFWGIIINHYLK